MNKKDILNELGKIKVTLLQDDQFKRGVPAKEALNQINELMMTLLTEDINERSKSDPTSGPNVDGTGGGT